jgi:predicted HNH restriction endonuclease
MRAQSLAEEIEPSRVFLEGAKHRVMVNAFERDPRARLACLAHYGAECCICGMSFGARYGSVAEGFIHIHHLRQLAAIGKKYKVNPVQDLRPVCPNCHAVLHIRGPNEPAYEIREVQAFLESGRATRRRRKRRRKLSESHA